jgi:hypothetical protein
VKQSCHTQYKNEINPELNGHFLQKSNVDLSQNFGGEIALLDSEVRAPQLLDPRTMCSYATNQLNSEESLFHNAKMRWGIGFIQNLESSMVAIRNVYAF